MSGWTVVYPIIIITIIIRDKRVVPGESTYISSWALYASYTLS